MYVNDREVCYQRLTRERKAQRQIVIKNLDNQTTKKFASPLVSTDGMFSGGTAGRILLQSEEKIVQLMGGDAQKAAHASAFKDDAAMHEAEKQAGKRRDSLTKVASTMGEEAARQIGTQ